MTIFGIEIVLTDAILALVCLVGVMIALVGGSKRSVIAESIGVTIAAAGCVLMLFLLR